MNKYRNQTGRADFHVFPSGLFINVQHPFFGPSPDGIVDCSCCGKGICEVKVAYYKSRPTYQVEKINK